MYVHTVLSHSILILTHCILILNTACIFTQCTPIHTLHTHHDILKYPFSSHCLKYEQWVFLYALSTHWIFLLSIHYAPQTHMLYIIFICPRCTVLCTVCHITTAYSYVYYPHTHMHTPIYIYPHPVFICPLLSLYSVCILASFQHAYLFTWLGRPQPFENIGRILCNGG